jgi:hypothetical protein
VYTVKQLVAASGGTLSVANRTRGSGAIVEVSLREELDVAPAVH